MGGSGGGYFSGGFTPDDLAKRTRQAEDQARKDTLETEVGGHLASLLADFNDRDVEGTRDVFNQIKADLENKIDGTIDTMFGGSISKHTYVDGISDVDALVLLNKSELADKSPDEVKSYLADCLRDRYGKDAVDIGSLAVTVSLQDTGDSALASITARRRCQDCWRRWTELVKSKSAKICQCVD